MAVSRFEMPVPLQAPRLVQPEIGIERLSRRVSASYSMEVTLLDTCDNRLVRAGVLLAERVVNGVGEYYLAAPGWQPWLPKEHVQPMGEASELPADLARLVRPFHRSAPLLPVAALQCERRDYHIRGVDGSELGSLRDEQVTIRRSGLTTARYREATMTPRDEMTRPQHVHLDEALAAAGGTPVRSFPSLPQRLGAPATGLTDFPEPRRKQSAESASLEGFVSSLFASRLQRIMMCDLACRAGETSELAGLRLEIEALLGEIQALSFALDTPWRQDADDTLRGLLDGWPASIDELGDAYLAALDLLISAARAPKLGQLGRRPASAVVRQQVQALLRIVIDRADALSTYAPDERWESTRSSAVQLVGLLNVGGILCGRRGPRLARRLRRLVTRLESTINNDPMPDAATLAALQPAAAFAAGREFQRCFDDLMLARLRFVHGWARVREQLLKVQVSP